MKELILTVGLPRSGKSTWAQVQGHPIVSPDAIRLALHGTRWYAPAEPTVWATAYLMARALFESGHETVVVDATNVSAKRRDAWLQVGADTIQFKLITTPPAECRRRAMVTQREDLLPVIDRMVDEWDLERPIGWPAK